MHIGTSS